MSGKWKSITKSQGGEKYSTSNRRRKAKWIRHILHRNCLLKHVTKGKIEGRIQVAERRGRRCKQLLDEFKGTIGQCKLK